MLLVASRALSHFLKGIFILVNHCSKRLLPARPSRENAFLPIGTFTFLQYHSSCARTDIGAGAAQNAGHLWLTESLDRIIIEGAGDSLREECSQ